MTTIWLLALACGKDPLPPPPGGAQDSDAPPVDSGEADDSGASGDGGGDSGGGGEDSGDDGGADSGNIAPPRPGAATAGRGSLRTDWRATCADPDAREREGPFYPAAAGEAWGRDQAWSESWAKTIYAGQGAAVADLDGDGFPDIFLPQEGPDQLYLQRFPGGFDEVGGERLPAGRDGFGTGAVAVDVEGDGDLDLFVTTVGSEDRLWLNDGAGYFTDATDASGLGGYVGESMGSVWADFDGDGDLDPYVAKYGGWSLGMALDSDTYLADLVTAEVRGLFRGRGDGTFEDLAAWLPEEEIRESCSFAAGWFDMTGDGRPELYLANDYRTELLCGDNRVYSVGEGALEDISVQTSAGIRLNSMGMSRGDLNGDGAPDLLMSGINEIALLLSLGDGSWYNASLSVGLTPPEELGNEATSWGTALADVDNDGDLDAFVGFGFVVPDLREYLVDVFEVWAAAGRQRDALYLQDDAGTFSEEVALDWGLDGQAMTRTTIFADFNRDGWLDLLRRNLDRPATLHYARCGAAGWLAVRLEDEGPNPFGVGARIEVEVGGETQSRWIDAGVGGVGSGGPPEAHFGLGDAQRIDALRVFWPDGSETAFGAVLANRAVTVVREAE